MQSPGPGKSKKSPDSEPLRGLRVPLDHRAGACAIAAGPSSSTGHNARAHHLLHGHWQAVRHGGAQMFSSTIGVSRAVVIVLVLEVD